MDDGEFVFIGDSLALDLVNTEVVVRGAPRDLLGAPADVAAWWDQARRHHPASALTGGLIAADTALLGDVTALRAALRRICDALVAEQPAAAADLAAINQPLAWGRRALDVDPAGQLRAGYVIEGGEAQRLLFDLALDALRLFTESAPERLHRCQNGRCILYFFDTTKSATRRWCSTACMNRARSHQHYLERKRQGNA